MILDMFLSVFAKAVIVQQHPCHDLWNYVLLSFFSYVLVHCTLLGLVHIVGLKAIMGKY